MRMLQTIWAAWHWQSQVGRGPLRWHVACHWHAKVQQVKVDAIARMALRQWHQAMQDAWCFRAFEEACAEKYAEEAALLRFGRSLCRGFRERDAARSANLVELAVVEEARGLETTVDRSEVSLSLTQSSVNSTLMALGIEQPDLAQSPKGIFANATVNTETHEVPWSYHEFLVGEQVGGSLESFKGIYAKSKSYAPLLVNHRRAETDRPMRNETNASILDAAREALLRHFGFGALRAFQAEAIAAWTEGRDALISMGTGSGKSLCFQLPALLKPSTLVISPLISLMQDQVRTLRQRQIHAVYCGSGGASIRELREGVPPRGGVQVIYMCPEFALTHLSELALLKGSVHLLAIDEAHCISSWGHDFRPSYQRLGELRELLGVPTMALTATCTPQVKQDILRSLHFKDGVNIHGSINRPNLKLLVRPRSTLQEDPRSVDNTSINCMSSSIIYVPTRAKSEELAQWLEAQGVRAEPYHAGLSLQARERLHTAFLLDEVQVVVATVAFGMGIDKPSIRRVVHYGGVKSIEDFVQQTGRAGRDGEEAETVAFTRPSSDAQEIKGLILQSSDVERGERLLALHREVSLFLSDNSTCRRRRLLLHFGEEPQAVAAADAAPQGHCVRAPDGQVSCRWCDVCLATGHAVDQRGGEFTQDCRVLLQCTMACGGYTGSGLVLAMAAGQSNANLRSKQLHLHSAFASGKHRTAAWWKAFLPHVLERGLLQERPAVLAKGVKYVALSVSSAGQAFLKNSESRFQLCPVPPELLTKPSPPAPSPPVQIRSSGLSLAIDQKIQELYKRLSHVRQTWMRRLNIMGEAIISNPILRALAEVRPSSVLAAQQHVPGLPALLHQDLAQVLEALIGEINGSCREFSLTQCGDERKRSLHAAEPPAKVPCTSTALYRSTGVSPRPASRRLPTSFGEEGSGQSAVPKSGDESCRFSSP
ncbi:unnamed protein product [Durusdinium trenchii]|uniref:ATP-dependent DNA helicase n=1 Tax=Durusdinium trenchii TaxID=1381693 RepID=A0ABP0SEW3_9DINO